MFKRKREDNDEGAADVVRYGFKEATNDGDIANSNTDAVLKQSNTVIEHVTPRFSRTTSPS